jgi:hypothetical protein
MRLAHLAIAFTVATWTASAKCPLPEMAPLWDEATRDFVCPDLSGMVQPEDHGPASFGGIDPAERGEFCALDAAERIKSCPAGRFRACCLGQTAEINALCLNPAASVGRPSSCELADAGSPSGAGSDAAPKPTVAYCDQMYQKRLRACFAGSRRGAGSPPEDDAGSGGCADTAATLHDECLAKAR